MAVRRLDATQPDSFKFSSENKKWAREQIKKYPKGKQASAVISLLWKAQEQAGGWLPEPAIRHVGEMLDMAHIRVFEVATFYTMFNLSPVGKHFVQLCGTTPCWLRGADKLKKVCKKVIGPEGRMSEDGEYSWIEVECLGACTNAPMVQINKDYYEDLDEEIFERILKDLKDGKQVEPGPQNGRQFSCPEGGPTTLTDPDLYKVKPKKKTATKKSNKKTETPKALKAPVEKVLLTDEHKPVALLEARGGKADDLKRIKGVGPKIEGILHGLGIYHFDQIGDWKKKTVDWVDDYLQFKGRITRDEWIKQAKTLAKGDAPSSRKGR